MELIEHPPIFRIPGIPDQVLYMWIVMGILLVVAVRGHAPAPARAARLAELHGESSSSSS